MVIFPILSFSLVGIGLKLGSINVNNTGCADNIALLSTQLSDAQIMVNMALDFANLEGYELQPNKQCETTNEKLNSTYAGTDVNV
jgi:hypothetical protein